MRLATCFIVVLISLEVICHSQGHIHANPPKNEGKVLFQVCHIIKIPLNGLTYNPAEHFSRFSLVRNSYNTRPDYMSNHSIRYIYCHNYQKNSIYKEYFISMFPKSGFRQKDTRNEALILLIKNTRCATRIHNKDFETFSDR